ncbi:MerR family transcriptional regulator [Microbulbifer sp. GL-2]|uniref:MerR family transcriptional regulator n=1 Tax=Microbulbifer sp. GL-2 TaxID=2591606 RepID=UPI001163646D|nr:MerR family transcriptional regulator [Microbulbifer sp. GL-2]BBM00589.1 transcriptional regulator [Microbulbifer sp. GL-2]
MVDEEVSEVAHLPIREVARRTGVRAVTLRAWERRYGLLSPARTSKGHRLYSEVEVRRIEKVLTYLARGVAIGQVRELVERGQGNRLCAEINEENGSSWWAMLDETCSLLEDFAEPQLRMRLDQWIAAFPSPLLIEYWLKPLQEKLGRASLSESGVALQFFWQLLNEQLLLANGIARRNLRKNKKTFSHKLCLLGLSGGEQQVFVQMFSAVLLAKGIDTVVFSGQAGSVGLEDLVTELEIDGVLFYSHRALSKHFIHHDLTKLASGLKTRLWLTGDFVDIQYAELAGLRKLVAVSVLSGTTEKAIAQLQGQLG